MKIKESVIYTEIRPDGKVNYRMPYTDPLTGKTKRASITMPKDTPKNRHEAEDALLLKIHAILGGKAEGTSPTLEHALAEYVTDMKASLKGSTRARNEATIQRIVNQFPPRTQLNSITVPIWKNTLMDLSKGKPGTYNEYIKRVKAFLRFCYKNDLLVDPKVIDKLNVVPDRTKREKISDKFLEPEEAIKLLSAMEYCPYWRFLTQFLILSGLRVGEALALKLSDVDLEERVIHVSKTQVPRTKELTSPKTLTSNRDVSIQSELYDMLEEYLKYRKRMVAAFRWKTDAFFVANHDDHIDYGIYEHYLTEVSERAIGRKITSHTLRHTSASLFLAAGVPIEVISRRLGHENSRITKEIYLHITERLKERDADIVSDISIL